MNYREQFITRFDPKVHPSMCPLLFNHFSTETSGEIKFCCEAKNNNPEMNGKYYKIIDIFNSDYYNSARENMINGEKLSECESCWIKENQGLTSKRLQEWEVFKRQPDNQIPKIFFEWEKNKNTLIPTYYNLQVAKTCNYACIMCSSDWSSLITSIGQKMGFEKSKSLMNQRWWLHNDSTDTLDKSDTFWEGLEEISGSLDNLYVTGGEPFIIKPLWKYINFLVDQGYSKNIVFWCNTNTSQFNEHQLELLKEFKRVELNLSIDGYGELNEYLRTSSDWSVIEKNVNAAVKYLDDKSFYLTLVPVVSGLNVKDLSKLIYWWKEKIGNNRCVIKPIILTWPRSMAINVLPKKYIEEAKSSLMIAHKDCNLNWESDFYNVYKLLDDHQFSQRANNKLKEEFTYFSEAVNKDYFKFFNFLFE